MAPVALAVLPKTSPKTITNVLISQDLSSEEIKQKAEAITVKIESDDTAVSGVIIGKESNTYTVLTNAHVINSQATHKIITNDDTSHEAKVIKEGNSLEGNDLAILTFNSPNNYQVATLAIDPNLQENTRVYSVGFPEETNQFYFTQGTFKLQAPKPFLGGYQIGYDIDVKSGMSGGALLNKKGELIGINGLRKDPILDEAYNYLDGSQPYEEQIENYRKLSFAVPIETLMEVDPDLALIPDEWKTGLNIAENVDNIARQITVRIDNKDRVNGSGAIVGKDGDTYYVFTACHVVSDDECQSGKVNDNYTLVTPDGEKYPLTENDIILPKGMDAAIIKFESKKAYKVVTIGDYNIPVTRQPLVFVSGFPLELKGVRKFTAGRRYQRDKGLTLSYDNFALNIDVSGYELLYSNLTRPGMSGGPVLDTKGQLIGINTGQEGEQGEQESSEDYQLGFAFGVPSSRLLAFAEQKKVNLNHFQVEEQATEKISDRDWKTVKLHPAFVLETPPKDSDEITWLNYGNQLFRLEREEEAITAYEKALEINPDFPEAYYGLGFMYEQLMYIKRKNTDNKDAGKEEAIKAIEAFDDVFELRSNFHVTGLALYRKSMVLQELEQYEEALIAIDQSIEYISSESKSRFYFQTYAQRGEILEDLGRYSEAKEAYDRSIEIYPSGFAYFNRGYLFLYKLNQPQEAIKDFDKAIESGMIFAYGLRASSYWRLKNYETALADINKSLEFQPGEAYIYSFRGIIYQGMKDYSQALVDQTKAIELDPNNAEHYNARHFTHWQLGNIPKALADQTKAIELDPENDDHYYQRQSLYFSNGQYKLALEDVLQAIKLNPKEAKYYEQSGTLRNRLGDTQGALEDYNKAIEIDPNYASAYYYRGSLYSTAFLDYGKAIADLTKAIELNPKFGGAYFMRGLIRGFLSDFKGELEDYNQAILLSKDPDPNIYLAWTGIPLEQYKYLERESSDMSNNNSDGYASVYQQRGNLRLKLKDTEGALQDYNQAIKLAPKKADSYVARGDYYTQMQQPEKAQTDYNQAIKIYSESIKNPTNKVNLPNHYSSRAKVYSKIKNYEAAIADYSKVIEIKPKSLEPYFSRGLEYLKINNIQATIEDFSKIIQLNKKAANPVYFNVYFLRGELYRKSNNYKGAIEDFSSFIKLQPENHQGYSYRCMVYTDLKDYNQAMKDCNQALAIAPNNPEVYLSSAA
ncbi:MAG: tetratricopeptide repeat protein, partial [Crocosphaera sp.]